MDHKNSPLEAERRVACVTLAAIVYVLFFGGGGKGFLLESRGKYLMQARKRCYVDYEI